MYAASPADAAQQRVADFLAEHPTGTVLTVRVDLGRNAPERFRTYTGTVLGFDRGAVLLDTPGWIVRVRPATIAAVTRYQP